MGGARVKVVRGLKAIVHFHIFSGILTSSCKKSSDLV